MIVTHVKFDSQTKEFIAKSVVACDMALAYMAQDIEIIIKTGGRTPFKKGKLRGDTYHERIEVARYKVHVPVEYAQAQETGIIKGKPIRNYTTPGTNKGFFAEAVNKTIDKKDNYIKQGQKVAGINA